MIAAFIAELIGTWMLASVVLATVGSTIPTAIAVGLCLTVLVGTIGSVSGAHVNPAVTLGLFTLGKVDLQKAASYIAAQVAGGLLALVTYAYMIDQSIDFTFGAATDGRVFVGELLGSAVFGFGIAAAVWQGFEKMQAAFTIGFSLFLGAVVASVAAPGFLNPSVALANGGMNWSFLLGPIIGMAIGMQLYVYGVHPSAVKPRKK